MSRALRRRVRAVALAMGLGCPVAVGAQTSGSLAVGFSAAWADIRLNGFDATRQALDGPMFGVEGRASLGLVSLNAMYHEGRLERRHLGGGHTRVVAGEVSAGLRLLPWVTLAAGPRVSTVTTTSGDRWIVRWRVEALGSVPLVAGTVSGFAAVASSVAGSDLEGSFGLGGGGADVGLRFARPDLPVWASLGYRMDRESTWFGASQRFETTYLSFGVALR